MIVKETWDSLLAFVSQGLTNKDACIAVGISEASLYNKLNSEKKEDLEFFESLKKAHIRFKTRHVKNIADAGSGQWQASAWLLERKFKQEFGKVEMQMSVKDDLEGKTDAELQGELTRLEEDAILETTKKKNKTSEGTKKGKK